MLQPMQLQEVFARYPREVTELRHFLVQAGVPVGTERVAPYMADRLAQDRRFHRDLMSYLWVLLDDHPTQIGPAELLGMLAIAAANVDRASLMEEEDAHDLLRFVMESRRALSSAERPQARPERSVPIPPPKPPPRVAEAPAPPTSPATPSQPVAALTAPATQLDAPLPEPSQVRASASAERLPARREQPLAERPRKQEPSSWLAPEEAGPEAPERTRRRLVYAFSGACVLALLVGGYGLLHHSEPSARPNLSSATGVDAAIASAAVAQHPRGPAASLATDEATETLPDVRQRSVFPAQHSAAPGRASEPQHSLPLRSAPHPSATDAAPATISRQPEVARLEPPRSSSLPATTSAAPIVRTGPTGSGIASAGVTLRTTRPAIGVPQAVPASSLSRQLDSPKMPVYANDPDVTAAGKPYPRLHRRGGTGTLQESDPELVAEMRAPNLAGAGSGSRSAAHALPSGIVRGTCLGMMAGNLTYSPTPAYPQAAAAARVQGEVKIQATIDRDGSISSARVVSGPPLLRDAALNAVEHWRYKPYTSGGKPSPTATVAVLEFELQ